MTVFALNIMPYISASIIIQLMTGGDPVAGGAEEGRRAGAQEAQPVHPLSDRVHRHVPVLRHRRRAGEHAWQLRARRCSIRACSSVFSCVITLVGGTMFLMWVGEQITARGIGNGTSLIIMAGIVANLPNALAIAAGTRPHRRAVAVLHPGVHRARGRGRRVHRVHGAGAAAHPRAISEAPGRQPDVRRRFDAHAAEDQHLGRDPADLRQLDPADPGDHRRLLRAQAGRAGCSSSATSSRTASRCTWRCMRR